MRSKFVLLTLFAAVLGASQLHAQNLLPLVWNLQFRTGYGAGFDARNSYSTNLLLSWERQGYCAQDGAAELSCEFQVPAEFAAANLTLTVDLACQVEGVAINGIDTGPRGPRQRGESKILIPKDLIKAGANRISIAVSSLSYTGGLSHNRCTLSPETGTADSAVRVNVASVNHVFVDQIPVASVHYKTAKKAALDVSVKSDFRDTLFHAVYPVEAGEGDVALDGAAFQAPGFYECVAMLTSDDHVGTAAWFAVSPEKLGCTTHPGEGLSDYWRSAKRELAAVKPEYKIRKIPEWSTGSRDGYVVDMKSLGGIEIQAFYFVPRTSGRHAVIIHVPGYGCHYDGKDFVAETEDVAELAVCVRGHEVGAPGLFDPPRGPGIWGYKIYDAQEYAYRGIYMDCVRGVDFLQSRPEIDTSRIGVMGGSQGGGLALATAGLCPDAIAACAYWDPWPCDLPDHIRIRTMIHKELAEFISFYKNTFTEAQAMQVLAYVDTKQFAASLKCPVLFGTGLFDDDCPPHIGFAAYNEIRTPKRYLVFPEGAHWERSDYVPRFKLFFKEQFRF